MPRRVWRLSLRWPAARHARRWRCIPAAAANAKTGRKKTGARWVRRSLGVSSVDLRLAARNLHTWTKYTGWDPETSLTGAVTAVSGADLQDTPQTRSFVLSVTLNW